MCVCVCGFFSFCSPLPHGILRHILIRDRVQFKHESFKEITALVTKFTPQVDSILIYTLKCQTANTSKNFVLIVTLDKTGVLKSISKETKTPYYRPIYLFDTRNNGLNPSLEWRDLYIFPAIVETD